MRTGRGFERLVTFSDAVIAIAMTLLVLPLVEIPSELTPTESVGDVLSDHSNEIGAFLISFLVIWILWSGHHRTMEYFRGYDSVLTILHMLWLLTLVVLPFTTQFLSKGHHQGEDPLYVGTLLLSAIGLLAIGLRGRHKRELLHTDRPEVEQWLSHPISYFTVAVLFIALVLCTLFPAVGAAPLLLLLLEHPTDVLVNRIHDRRRSANPN
jgi:uncharacterized membrane protein